MKTIEKILNYFGYKKYNCTNCKKNSYLNGKYADEIVAGYCRKCRHPIWYMLILVFVLTSCQTYNLYIIEEETPATISIPEANKISSRKPKGNRFSSQFFEADSLFNASKDAVIKTNEYFNQHYGKKGKKYGNRE